MNLPRFRLPRRRHPRAVGRHHQPSTRRAATPRPTTRSTRTPGPRAAVGGAMAVLAVTAVTATAVTGGPAGAESSTTTSTTDASTVVVSPDLATAEPTVVVSQDETTVRASSALQRATDVTTDQATLSKAQERKIDAQVEKVAGLLESRDADSASRSGERSALPQGTAAPAAQGDGSPVTATADEILAANRAAEREAAQDASGSAPDRAQADETERAEETPAEEQPEEAEPAQGEAEPAEAESTALAKATDTLVDLLDAAQSDTVDVEAAPETPADITAAQVAAARQAAAGLTKYVDSVVGYGNGQIPSGELCELDFAPGETLRCDAAEQLERLDVAYAARFGEHLSVNDSYRSYAAQVATKAARGAMAAVPGYSNHGWGVAVDLNGGVESFGTAKYEWLRENGPKFGWDNPGWARADGRKPEAWHWEYSPIG
ncbi:M15 family metallopeptidase [Isoptericola dokdonensis]|nr:M15 family metallopeptidase [Isoptericola dokdonensis]